MVFRWWRRWKRERAIHRDLVAANGPEHDGDPRHLSPGLRHVARQARTLRLVLETPVGRIRTPLLSESPWRRRERCDEYDAMLTEIRRAVWDWLREVEVLDDHDRQVVAELGLSLQPFRSFLFRNVDRTNDSWEQVVWAEAPNLELVHRELMRTILELKRFEDALVHAPADPYRATG